MSAVMSSRTLRLMSSSQRNASVKVKTGGQRRIFRQAPSRLLFPSLLCFLAAGSPVEAARVKWEVSGSGFEGHPSLPELRRQAGDAASEALGRLRVELGIVTGSLPIRWLLDASETPRSERSPRFFQLGSTSFTEGAVLVRLPVGEVLARAGERTTGCDPRGGSCGSRLCARVTLAL